MQLREGWEGSSFPLSQSLVMRIPQLSVFRDMKQFEEVDLINSRCYFG